GSSDHLPKYSSLPRTFFAHRPLAWGNSGKSSRGLAGRVSAWVSAARADDRFAFGLASVSVDLLMCHLSVKRLVMPDTRTLAASRVSLYMFQGYRVSDMVSSMK